MDRIRYGMILLGLCIGFPCTGGEFAPASYVDEGACPFECCTYGAWGVEQDTRLLAVPARGAKVLGFVGKGSTVHAITGQVVTSPPGTFEVLRDYLSGDSGQPYLAGEIVNVYTYLGEGYFRVWHAGAMHDEEAAFMVHGIGGWVGCADDETCWGKRASSPESTWWVHIRALDGLSGWTDEADHFSGKDACG